MTMRMKACQYCQESFELASTGRPPRYCSATCRKKAWEAEKIRQAVTVAKAQAVAAERRRVAQLANRGNETLPQLDIRGNETPSQATPPPDPRQRWTWTGLGFQPQLGEDDGPGPQTA